ncbi:amidohydrolase family protein [Marinobacter bryozoorum]|uniref:amidohydrolase family protein n=1 Tax=Marinobacter bryozoorum TaxID=256324 RepID=UPI002002CBEC|nr:amidohydrolase family protein [Marinobacter bryozoorum]MCK7546050.1 amidohydrolase family protein [Marinobacter bryozoorum]
MNYLIRNAVAIHTEDNPTARDIRIQDGLITELGWDLVPTVEQPETIIDASGCVIWPGLVNTHHHLAQSIMKGVPAGLNQGLGEWLSSVPYRFWPKVTPELMYHAARLGLYELIRSGATTCADHHYLYHATTSPELEEAVWQAADELGIRLVLCRGSATETGSHEGMIEHRIEPETIDQVIDRLDATRKKHHQEGAGAMKKLVVAPTSLIHSSTPDGLRAQAQWAREHGLKMHSHLLEVAYDEVQAREKYHQGAIDYADACDWLGPDVWYAHLVHSDPHAIERLAATGTGIAHCPTSNCRLGSGIAPVVAMEKAGVPISLAVDGSASAESGSMLQELNLAWLIHRAAHGPDVTTLEQVLDWGTRGGADLLGLQETGSLAVGKQADLVLYDIDQPRFAGVHSPLMAPLMCGEPVHVKHSFVQGRCVMEDGLITGLDERELTRKVQEGVARMLAGA